MNLEYISNFLIVGIKSTICVILMLVASYIMLDTTCIILDMILGFIHIWLMIIVILALLGATEGDDLFKSIRRG